MDRHRVSLPPTTPPLADAVTQAPDTLPRPDALPPGTRLAGFQIEQVIGSSGFGLVYLANDEAFKRHVAIKEYLPDTLALRGEDGQQVLLRASAHADTFARGRRAFVDEARLLARCQHPSLVQVLRSWEANGTVYRAMPHYPGHSLLALRQALNTPPDEASLRALLDGLLDALETLHAAGTIHREVAPGRILVMPDDRPVLLDFSAARRAIVGDRARALLTLLAPSFAPLEQIAPSRERPQGPWTDLYALAAVVKYCISGELPPPASLYGPSPRDTMGALARRMRARFPLLHFSGSFLAAIDQALAPRPQDRPQSVAEFRRMLDDHPPARAEREPPELSPADESDSPGDDDRPLGPFSTPAGAAPNEAATTAPAGDRPFAGEAPVSGVAGPSRRRRRWLAWAGGALVLSAAGTGAWVLDPQRLATWAQTAWEHAAPPDRLTAKVPALPAPPGPAGETPGTVAEPALLTQAPTAAAAPSAEPTQAPSRQAEAATSSSGTEAAGRSAPPAATGPREACGQRTQFSLYRCMQTQCAQRQWAQHPACKRLRARDEVG